MFEILLENYGGEDKIHTEQAWIQNDQLQD